MPVTKESGSYRLKNEKQSAVAGSLLNKKDFIFHTVKSNKYNCIMRCSLVGMHTKREGWFAIVGGQMCVTDYILKSCTKKAIETIGRPRPYDINMWQLKWFITMKSQDRINQSIKTKLEMLELNI